MLESRCEPNSFAIVDMSADPTGIARRFVLPVGASSAPRVNTGRGPGRQAQDFSVDLGRGQVTSLKRADCLAAPGGWLELDAIPGS